MTDSPYEPPKSTLAKKPRGRRGRQPRRDYASFWQRLVAVIIDGAITWAACLPIGFLTSPGFDLTNDLTHSGIYTAASLILPLVYTIGFWMAKGATPGKLILGIRIVDRNGDIPGVGTCIGRYVGYLVSGFTCLVGYLWMLWDDESQTLHDKIASTYVVKS